MKKLLATILLVPAFVLVVGCGGSSTESSKSNTTAGACTPGQLSTHTDGVLTVATGDPAQSPYFIDNDPSNGKGFEGSLAYAIGKQLGYPRAQVEWVTEPLSSAYAPGPKDFDFDLNQISITPAHAKKVDLSSTYFIANEGVVALKGSGAAEAGSLADLKGAKIGVQAGTTGLSAVKVGIDPGSKPEVFDSSSALVAALKDERVDAIAVPLPTAFQITATQVPNADVVGQFNAVGGEEWGALLAKGSPLTKCVTKAIDKMRFSGELTNLNVRWMSLAAGAPPLF